MADIPGTVPSFENLEDNVDFVEAEDQNNPNDEIESLATEVGMFGAGLTQADGIDLFEMFRKARQSFRLTWSDVDTITVSQGEVVCVNAGVTQRVPRKNGSTTDITFADIDTGARTVSTTYYVYAVADAAANTVTFSISESAVAPDSVTRFALLGKFATNSTGSGEIIEKSVVSYVGEVVVQTQREESGELATGSVAMVEDDSKPTYAEGDEYLVLPILPTDIGNRIRVDVVIWGAVTSGGVILTSLFQNGTGVDEAEESSFEMGVTSNVIRGTQYVAYLTPSTIDLINIQLRAGGSSGTFTLNGVNAARVSGGALISSLTATEYRKVYR